jgi:hypothetical protein
VLTDKQKNLLREAAHAQVAELKYNVEWVKEQGLEVPRHLREILELRCVEIDARREAFEEALDALEEIEVHAPTLPFDDDDRPGPRTLDEYGRLEERNVSGMPADPIHPAVQARNDRIAEINEKVKTTFRKEPIEEVIVEREVTHSPREKSAVAKEVEASAEVLARSLQTHGMRADPKLTEYERGQQRAEGK